jgi:hypothetical protein
MSADVAHSVVSEMMSDKIVVVSILLTTESWCGSEALCAARVLLPDVCST